MATFYNQATLSYGQGTINSNITEAEILTGLQITKTAVTASYGSGDGIVYVITLSNNGANAYNALTPGSKQYVTQLAVLEEAEAIYAGIFPLWAIILIAVGGVLVLAGGAVATVLILKRKKAAAAEEPTTEPEA